MSHNLTKAERKQLAESLVDTQKNIYHESKRLFGKEISEKQWSQMEIESEIFHCEYCSFFRSIDVRSLAISSECCVGCEKKHFKFEDDEDDEDETD